METFNIFMSRVRNENSENNKQISEEIDSVVAKELINEEINSSKVDEPIKEDIKTEEVIEEVIEEVAESISGYKIFRDKTETFVCDMEISGANPLNSKARIIIESQDMTYMFEGTIDGKGHCEIPLKKMNFLSENEMGKIKLEVIADDMMFNPWEDTFVAVNSKKVVVKVAESVNNTPKVGVRISNIR